MGRRGLSCTGHDSPSWLRSSVTCSILNSLGVLIHTHTRMQRWTARFLLLLALVGTFVPLALAATAAPTHACCLRKAHHCHESAAADSEQLAIRNAACCNHDCCRAVTTPQWAQPQPGLTAVFARNVDARVAESRLGIPATQISASLRTRKAATAGGSNL